MSMWSEGSGVGLCGPLSTLRGVPVTGCRGQVQAWEQTSFSHSVPPTSANVLQVKAPPGAETNPDI